MEELFCLPTTGSGGGLGMGGMSYPSTPVLAGPGSQVAVAVIGGEKRVCMSRPFSPPGHAPGFVSRP
jgi:hypothetical protein